MPGYAERISGIRKLVDGAHEAAVPIAFVKEIHRPDHVDFGREMAR